MESVTFDGVREVFAATADTYADGSGTAYTAIYDPVRLTATVYFWRDFEHPIRFNLADELSGPPHVVALVDLAHPNPRRDAWVFRAEEALARRIEARIDRSIPLDAARAELVGHYTVEEAVGIVPSPPVMIEGVSVVWDNGPPLWRFSSPSTEKGDTHHCAA